jgi:integrase
MLAVELALLTGQRQGDLFRLTWGSYDGKRLRFRQGKSRRRVDLPVTGRLREILEAAKASRRALTILETPTGKPWTKSHFNNHWRPALKAAGLDGLHFHDLRGTACTKLAEAGCSYAEIAAVLGWSHSSVARMLEIYQAMTAPLSDSAVAKLEARK